MTPEDLSESAGTAPLSRPRTTQFGILRMLLWMSPGFGVAVLWVCLSDFRSAIYCVDLAPRCWISGAAALLSIAAFAWLDALANPAVEKRDGQPTTRAMWLSVAWFMGGQILTLPPVALGTMVLAEIAGFRT